VMIPVTERARPRKVAVTSSSSGSAREQESITAE